MKNGHFIGIGLVLFCAVYPGAYGQNQRYEPSQFKKQGLQKLDQAGRYFDAGNYTEAVRIYREAYDSGVLSRADMYDYARCYTFLGDDNSADRIYQEVIQNNSYQSQYRESAERRLEIVSSAHYQLGKICERRQKWGEALSEFELATSGSTGWLARMAKGIIRAQQYQDYPAAINDFESALRVKPEETALRENLGACYLELGKKYLAENDRERATQSFDKALEYRPAWDVALEFLDKVRAMADVSASSPPRAPTTEGLPKSVIEFFAAVIHSDAGKMTALLKAEPELVRAKDNDGQTALFYATSRDIAAALIDAGADVNEVDRHVKTPLMTAAAFAPSPQELVDLFVNSGADVAIRYRPGYTAASYAEEHNRPELAKYLSALAAIGPKPGEAMIKAVEARDAVTIKKLLAISPALVAAEIYFERGTTLHVAAARGFEDIAGLLLEAKVEVNARNRLGDTALIVAARQGNEAVLRLLLAKGADSALRNSQGETALIAAAGAETENPCLALLVDAGADVNAVNSHGSYALSHCVGQDRREAVAFLLEHGANPNMADKSGGELLPLLHEASLACTKLLVAKGADVNARDKYGGTPLHRRAAESLETVEFFVTHDAKINARDNEGKTPLDEAMEYEKYLKEQKDDAGLAENRKIVAYLQTHGAKQGKDLPNSPAGNVASTKPVKTQALSGAETVMPPPPPAGPPPEPSKSTAEFFNLLALAETEKALGMLQGEPDLAQARDPEGRTALFHVKLRDLALAEALIKAGAEVNARDASGSTPLHLAVTSTPDFVKLLVTHSAEINARDGNGLTPLDQAMKYEKLSTENKWLLSLADIKGIIPYLQAHGAKQGQDLK